MSHFLHVESCGPVDAPTLVFLHGGGGGGWMWQPVVQLMAGYHCLVPDLPEHGLSKNVKPFTIENAAEQVAQLIRASAHGGHAHVVGLSEGAQVAVALLDHAPDIILSAIVSSALLRALPGAGLLTPGVLAATYYTTVAPLKHVDSWIRLNMKYAAGIPESYFARFKQDFQTLNRTAWENLMRANLSFRLPAGLARAAAPTLVVVGSKEYAAMKQSARDLAAALPNARSYSVNLGKRASLAQEHNWALNAPGPFADMVRAWIEHTSLPGILEPLS